MKGAKHLSAHARSLCLMNMQHSIAQPESCLIGGTSDWVDVVAMKQCISQKERRRMPIGPQLKAVKTSYW